MKGRIVFVAVPPGGKDWLPIRAHDALANCDAVVHDGGDGIAELLALAPPGAVRRMGAVDLGVELVRAGKTVVRLTDDEVLFDGGEGEVDFAFEEGVPFEIVPGVRPETAVASFAGFPFSSEGAYAVVDARSGAGGRDWASLASATELLIAQVSRETLDEVVAALLEHGRSPDTGALALTGLGRPTQRVEQGVLSDIATRARRLPGEDRMLVVGDVVRRRSVFRWFDKRPLFGKRVLVTRTQEQSRSTLALLRARGAEPVSHPAIEIHPPPDPGPMQSALARLTDYDFVAFTSENGVACAWKELQRQGRDARAFGSVQIAVIGPGTARELAAHGLRADIVAKEFRGEGLAEELLGSERARAIEGRAPRILIARALVARDALPEALRARGWAVDVVALYETRAPGKDAVANLARALEDGAIDAVTFTSKSTVDNLASSLGLEAAPRLLAKSKVAVIGPVTRDAAEALGIRVDVMASPYTVDALVCALETSFADAYF